ncbi:TetR/AcrR family transcriptional regulator [Bacillus horti]|uniref:AcrR family transcriptional regulator n=1 Tax=Caldalkalibacillus horti TaxID=77523 RepID=A0ABT9VXB8_9BACI|nr:TetR/AcrR family transcriptional regulator [Bacillus horti]MDQ0165637.1 AcrR family transcriptional regulator [Bacillus horti]
MRRKKEEAQETIRKLIEIGRTHFTEKGFATASLEEIVQEAAMTRGALYHHFGSKKGLFQVVIEHIQSEVAEQVEVQAAQSGEDMWEQLLSGCRAFITTAVEPRNRRILLIDGPAVLGWEEWRKMDERNSMRLLRGQLEEMQQKGYLKEVPLVAMTHALSGALNEMSLWLAQLPDYERGLEEALTILNHLLKGFKS